MILIRLIVLVSTLLLESTVFSASSDGSTTEGSEALIAGCTDADVPKNSQPIENWHMIAGNTAQIGTSDAFSGSKILYSVSALVTNRANIVMINRRNGIVKIEAVAEDEFPVTVQAQNPCGVATVTFNVKITIEN